MTSFNNYRKFVLAQQPIINCKVGSGGALLEAVDAGDIGECTVAGY
jgi:hypothetical protein